MNFRPMSWLSTLLPGNGAQASNATVAQPPAARAPGGPAPDTPLGGLAKVADKAAHNPATRLFRTSTTTVTKLESTKTSSGGLKNPLADASLPRPPRRQPVAEPAPPTRDEVRMGVQGSRLGGGSVQRASGHLVTGGTASRSAPVPKFMSPRAIRSFLSRTRQRTLHAEARSWADDLDRHFETPTLAVSALFPAPASSDPKVAAAHGDALNALLDGLTQRRQRPAQADAALPKMVERLPHDCVMPLATALARTSGGDARTAARILARLQEPLDIDDARISVPDEATEQQAWQCAQDLAHTRCAALDGLLRLQYGAAQADAERGNGKAARLVVYLQAGHKLRTLEKNLGATPAALNPDRTRDRLLGDTRARQAVLALSAARQLPGAPANAHDIGTCSPEQVTAYRTWQWGFDESGRGSPLDKASRTLYESGTTWVELGAKRQALKDRAMGSIDGAPPAQRMSRAKARVALAAHDVPRAFSRQRTPYRAMPNMLGADVPFFDTLRGQYDTALIDVRTNLLDYSRQQMPHATNPAALMNMALNAGRLETWSTARPDVPTDAAPRELQKRRPESFNIGRREAQRMWRDARDQVAGMRTPANDALIQQTLDLFDSRERRDAFVKEMTHGAPSDAAKSGFTLAALERWTTASGMLQDDPALATQLREKIDAARKLTTQPGIASLERISTENLRDQQHDLMKQNVLGTIYTSYDGGMLGLDMNLWGNLPAKIRLTSVGPILAAMGGRDAVYAVGTAYDGGQMQFGTRNRVNTSLGAQGFLGVGGELGKVKGIAGAVASASVNGAVSREDTVVLRAHRASATRLGHTPDANQWRDDSGEMIDAYWDAIEQSASPEGFMQKLAELTADNPRISLSSQSYGATTITATPTAGVAVRANVDDSPTAPNRVGLYVNAGLNTTLFAGGNRTESGEFTNVVDSTVFQNTVTAGAGAQFAPRLIQNGDGHGDVKSVSAPSKTLAAASTEFARAGRSGFIYLTRDSRGFVPEFMLRDVMYRNADDWRHAIRGNPAWVDGVGAQRLEQVIEQAQDEASGEFAFGERWIIKEERVPKLNHYLTLSNQLNEQRGNAPSRRERAAIDAKLLALETKIHDELNDPHAWRPLGLYGLRETTRSSSQGWKYGVRASHEQTQSGVGLTMWAPVTPRPAVSTGSSATPAAPPIAPGSPTPGAIV
ncbi:hypothetical protein A6V36_24015 [Paraburkholderia ginsengiterrae]|uniref:Uncharacterized protein n=1 Tax=Paraburkholderia ginsengiterrae TaxID=1462993 RepID=A0A1A9N9T5_9BURK|nr:hypothetical protein [Paraburkholderia ginsengiterrae]OAJ61447.1 hypothetical protein A6V36_24015 [Paraburkholderia ginsengiterrae]OAJ62851.1 hypothetical protein A6V37_21795 [Paraburkholderia ginsengiterrae]